ncbi:hypothetical protein Patl1_17537 [Pistacia atlantica]|uniref:Uncharacterized protein n=1 Tax=Pistacia atlantica TaxID=434234 RepID=A0ACC1C2R3_9ROSI|nr:hypothetical protein Patl1_17537 [Pistacia atlantica]
MEGIRENSPSFSFSEGADIRSSLSQLILTGGTNTIDSIFSHCPPTPTITGPVPEPLGSSVYLRQRDILQKFSEENRTKTNPLTVKKERAKKNTKKSGGNVEAKSGATENEKVVDSCSSSSTMSPLINWDGELVSPTVSEDGFWKSENSQPSVSTEYPTMFAEESGFEGCSLARLPSYDPELIWEVLAN